MPRGGRGRFLFRRPRRRTMLGLRVSLFRLAVAAAMLAVALFASTPAPAQSGFDRPGGDYPNYDVNPDPKGATCEAACKDENRCRAWTYVRPGYLGTSARCFLKERITAPRHKPCCVSGVVR